jgi:hypothetical protein
MRLDPRTLLHTTNLATFLLGAAAGIAARYVANRYSDTQVESARSDAAQTRFAELCLAMPALLNDMARDVMCDTTARIRDFVILANERVSYVADTPCFKYCRTTHPDILDHLAQLTQASFVTPTARVNAYSMVEDFRELLLAYAQCERLESVAPPAVRAFATPVSAT